MMKVRRVNNSRWRKIWTGSLTAFIVLLFIVRLFAESNPYR